MLVRILENWPYKLLALAIAIVLRVYVGSTLNPQQTKTITMPVTVRDVPDNLIATDYPTSVKVDVSGAPTVVDGLGPSDVTASINADRGHAGLNDTLPIVVSVVPGLRDSVQVIDRMPIDASVYLDPKQSATMSIHAEFSQTAPVGYQYQLPTVTPATARVDGPESDLKKISRLAVSVDSDGIANSSIDDTEPIVAVDGSNSPVDGVTVTPMLARVVIPIHKVGAFKSLVISPQITGAPKFPYRVMEVDVDPTMVVVSGAAKQLDQTSVVVTDPIDLTQRTDTFTQTVNLSLPYGLSVLQNPSVNVTIHIGVSQPSGPVP